MYHAKIWDEDKLDVRASIYSSAKYNSDILKGSKDDKLYHEQKYADGKESPSDYMRKSEEKEDLDKKEKSRIEEELEEKKEKKLEEDEIPLRAAKQVFSENMEKYREKKDTKSNLKTIEDAITKAIKKEKEVVIMD